LFITAPNQQLERIARRLNIPLAESHMAELRNFADHFVDPSLRHAVFTADDFDKTSPVSVLVGETYLLLLQLAADEIGEADFWREWKHLQIDRRMTDVGAVLQPASLRQMWKKILLFLKKPADVYELSAPGVEKN
jgi:hypothetical protein